MAFLSGWGTTKIHLNKNSTGCKDKFKYSDLSHKPKEVMLNIVSEKDCQDNFDKELCNLTITTCELCDKSTLFCAYGLKHLNATIVEGGCPGDSGGITTRI